MDFAALELVYADFYRTAGDIQRVAELSGLDPTKLSVQGTSPAVSWHNVLVLAEQENRMADLYAIVRKEHPRNGELPAAWNAYQETSQPPAPRPAQARNTPQSMSDNYRYDNRIDALQKELSDLKSTVARLESTLNFLISQNNAMSEQNKAILRVLDERTGEVELPNAFQWYVAGFVAIVLVVFAIVYFGGHA